MIAFYLLIFKQALPFLGLWLVVLYTYFKIYRKKQLLFWGSLICLVPAVVWFQPSTLLPVFLISSFIFIIFLYTKAQKLEYILVTLLIPFALYIAVAMLFGASFEKKYGYHVFDYKDESYTVAYITTIHSTLPGDSYWTKTYLYDNGSPSIAYKTRNSYEREFLEVYEGQDDPSIYDSSEEYMKKVWHIEN